jgi:large subunit ribosomal protein L25
MAEIIVEGAPRSDRGKNAARRLRRTGQVPAVLYGGAGDSVSLAVNAKQVAGILRSESGHNTVFQVKLGGRQHSAIVKDWQVDPVTGGLLHVDLLRVAMDVRVRVKVPVHTFGEPAGVKQQGGIFEMVTREVEIECLPGEIPSEFRVDISPLMIGKQLRVADLPIDPGKAKLVTEAQRVVAHVVAVREEEEKPAAEAAVVEAAAAAPAEPEVIKKGKREEEGEEAVEVPEEKPEKAREKKK